MAEQTADRVPANRHEAIAFGIESGLRDMGADLIGCTPSMLTGTVLRELRRVPVIAEDAAEDQGPPRTEAEERKAKFLLWLGAERDHWFRRAAELEADKNVLTGQLRTRREITEGHHLMIASGEQEIAELTKFAETVKAFINRRPEVIVAIEDCDPDCQQDYWRWQGHAEAMGNLARALGLTVPHNLCETTKPATPKGNVDA